MASLPGTGWRWRAPAPEQLPDWRNDLRDGLTDRRVIDHFTDSITAKVHSLIPRLPGGLGEDEQALRGAQLLLAQERDRLANARLYLADSDATSLAIAVGATAPGEPVSIDRLPSPYGLLVFDSPIGESAFSPAGVGDAVPVELDADLGFYMPVVAVSWGLWSPDGWDFGGATPCWRGKTADGYERIPDDAKGVWITFYSSANLGLEALDPATPLMRVNGRTVTAGERIAGTRGEGPLAVLDELVLAFGQTFAPSAPGTVGHWAHILYTAWQLMQDTGRTGWTETERIERTSAGRKRDRRADLDLDATPDLSAVNVVRLKPKYRPAPADTARDLDASDPTRTTRCDYRWPVAPYRQPNRCFNPHIHTDDPATRPCRHGEKIVRGHVNGPKGKPIRAHGPVNLWTLPPQYDAEPATSPS